MVSGMSVWFVTDWNLAFSSGLTCYRVIEASCSSKLADKHRKQISPVGGWWMFVAEFGKERILWVMQDFCVSGLHSSPAWTPCRVSLLLSSHSELFFQDPTSPCLLRRGSPCQPPRAVPGSSSLCQDPLTKISAKPCLSSCSCVSQSKCLTYCAKCSWGYFFCYLDWSLLGWPSSDIFRLHINRESWNIWWLCLRSLRTWKYYYLRWEGLLPNPSNATKKTRQEHL